MPASRMWCRCAAASPHGAMRAASSSRSPTNRRRTSATSGSRRRPCSEAAPGAAPIIPELTQLTDATDARSGPMLVATRDGEAQSSEVVAEAPYSTLSTRSHQMFPTLTPAEIERVRRFGDLNHWHAGEYLFRTGHMGPGMIVMLSGTVRITHRDGLGRENLVVEHKGAGQFLAEVGQLSGKRALVDGIATMPVSAVLIPPERLRALIIAEAELGERIMRALILRRVALIEKGT